MISRFGFKWILPCVMVALNLCLLGLSIATEPKPQPVAHVTNPSDSSDTVTFSPTPYPPTSTVFKIAMILSLPAVFVGGIVASFVPHSGQTMDIAISTIFVFPLWYRIGRWIDRQRGPARPPSLVRANFRSVVRALVGVLLAISLLGLTPANHHRTSESVFGLIALSLWCTGYLVCSQCGGRRERKQEPAA